MQRRDFLAASTGLAATALLPGAASAQAPERGKVTIAVGGKASLYYLPLSIADQLGYFKAEGLEVTIPDFAGGSRALAAVVGGSADVVSGAFEHTISLQSKGQQFQVFVLQGRAPMITLGVGKAKADAVKSIADLKGLKIGVSAPGSSTNMVVNFALSRHGLKASDVSIIGVGTGAGAVSALRSGQIDAMSNIDPVTTILERSGDLKPLVDTRTLKGCLDVFGGPMPAATLYAPVDFVQKNPNTCQALANAIVRADKWIQQAGPSEIVKAVPESYLLGDRAVYIDAYLRIREAISPDGLVSEAMARTSVRVMADFEASVKADKIDLAKIYTNTFAQRANQKYPKG
jgi:NitT/TauT family transport system substrate-binding protein